MPSNKQVQIILQAQIDAVDAEVDEVGLAAGIAANATEISNMKDGSSAFTVAQITEIHDTAINAKVIAISPGHATPVNFWRINGSGASDPLLLEALGTATDLDISMTPKGTGKLCEGLVPVAISSEAAQADSVAADTAAMVVDFNLLLAKLRTARILDP